MKKAKVRNGGDIFDKINNWADNLDEFNIPTERYYGRASISFIEEIERLQSMPANEVTPKDLFHVANLIRNGRRNESHRQIIDSIKLLLLDSKVSVGTIICNSKRFAKVISCPQHALEVALAELVQEGSYNLIRVRSYGYNIGYKRIK